jgi:hypothetical protein
VGAVSLIAGVAALALSGGGLILAARRKQLDSFKPSAVPPGVTLASSPAAAKLSPMAKFAALRGAMERRKIAFYRLTPRERELVVAADYLKQSILGVIAEIELPFTSSHGEDEIKARGGFYALLSTTLLNRWPLILDPASRVYLLEVTKLRRYTPENRVTSFHDLQLPPPRVTPDMIGARLYYWAYQSAAASTRQKPAGWFAKRMHDSIADAHHARTQKPWKPTDLSTAPMPPEWVIDLGRAISNYVGAGDTADSIAEAAQKAAKDSMDGAERVFSGKAVTAADMDKERLATIDLLMLMVALCDFWAGFRWW